MPFLEFHNTNMGLRPVDGVPFESIIASYCHQAGLVAEPGPLLIPEFEEQDRYVGVVNPPKRHPDKFHKVRILDIQDEDADEEKKITLRNTDHISLFDIELLDRSRAYFPNLLYATNRWMGFEFLHGVTEQEFVMKVSSNYDLMESVAMQGAQILYDLAHDGLALYDIHFAFGHNLLLTPEDRLRLYDWDAIQDASHLYPDEILLDRMEYNLYQDIVKKDLRRPQDFANDIYLLVCQHLFEVCPELLDLKIFQTRTRYYRPAHLHYQDIRAEYQSGQSDRNIREKALKNGQVVYVETYEHAREISPEFLSAIETGDANAFYDYLKSHIRVLDEKVELFSW